MIEIQEGKYRDLFRDVNTNASIFRKTGKHFSIYDEYTVPLRYATS